jgi:eukaryotic-like serine/threonine-protein kinase
LRIKQGMTETKRQCPKCGLSLEVQGMGGLCPRCVALDFLAPKDFAAGSDAIDGAELLDAEERRMGGYELIEELGRGGMGVVYRARQLALGREVAIKFLLHGVLAGDHAIARFRAEAEAVARLRHPHIVTVYEVGEERGRQFLSMELVRGRTLVERLREGPLPARQAASCLKKVAEALHYAHSRGVLHRDLKPDNVLMDEHDEPRVTDFGLAKLADTQAGITLSGHVLGTPAYLSPEQAGAGSSLDQRSDVYSLGATLYHLITGRPPFVGESPAQILRQVVESDPVMPRLLNPALPRDLETICMKCVAKEPERRFASAMEFAEDLGRYLIDEPIRARPAGSVERTWRWCRRRPALAVALAGIMILLAGIAVVSNHAAQRIEGLRLDALKQLYASDMRLAEQAIAESKFGAAAELLERHRPEPGDPDLRGFEWRYFNDCCRSEEAAALERHPAQVQRAAFSPDGRLIATASVEVQVWDAATHQLRFRFPTPDYVWALAFAPDGSKLLVGDGIGSVFCLDAPQPEAAGKRAATTSLPRVLGTLTNLGAHAIAFSWPTLEQDPRIVLPDGLMSWDGVGTNFVRVAHFENAFYRAQVSPDGTAAAGLAGPNKIALWKLNPPAPDREFSLPLTTRAIAVSPDGTTLAAGDYAGRIRIWRLRPPAGTNVWPAHRGLIECLAFSPDGTKLASAGVDQIIRLHDVSTGTQLGEWHGHRGTIMALAFSPDGRSLVSGDKLGDVKLWNLTVPPKSQMFTVGQETALATDGSRAVTWGGDGGATLHAFGRLAENDQPLPLPKGWWPLPSSRGVVAVDSSARLHSLDANGVWREHVVPGLTINRGGTLSPDGQFVCLRTSEIAGPLVWDLTSGREILRVTNEPAWLSPTFSSDGRRLACGSATGRVHVWEIPSGREVTTFEAHQNYAYACDLSPDGRRLATAGFDGVVRLWDLERGVLLGEYRSNADAYWTVALSPDGSRLAAGTSESSIVIWDAATRLEVAALPLGGPLRPVEGVLRFTPDGTALVQGQDSLRCWNAPPLESTPRAKIITR